MAVSAELTAYLQRAVAKAGSQRKLALAIGVTEGRISKLLTNPHVDPLSELNCLRLALFLRESDPRPILIAAGKQIFADALETYLHADSPSPDEKEILRDLRTINEPERSHWLALLHTRGQDSRRRKR